MNVYEALEAGRYPKDKNGDQLVPTLEGGVATIYTLHYPVRGGKEPILGILGGFLRSWDKNGAGYDSDHHLMPPRITYKFNTCFVIDNKTSKVVYICIENHWDDHNLAHYKCNNEYSLVYRVIEGEIPL